MASYNSIHIHTNNTTAIHRAINNYIAKLPFWKFWRRRAYDVQLPQGHWTEVLLARQCEDETALCEHLSKVLNCSTLSLGFYTVVGQKYIQLCEAGQTRRLLWYSHGDDIYRDEGTPLEFEGSYIAARKAEAENELAGMDIELRSQVESWMLSRSTHLPDCAAFAKELRCTTYCF